MTAARSMLFAGLILAALRPGFAATDPAPVVLYETHLEEGQEAPADWSAEGGGALWGPPGRSGKSLKITTTLGEPKETKWIGPEIPCGQEQALRITGWQASNVIWMQDYLYCGVVAATFFDAQGQEMARGLVANLSPSPKPIRYVYEWFVPEGLFWTSFSGVVKVPAGATTVRPVFAFSHYTESWRDVLLKGDVWVDDLRITSAPLPEPDRPATEPGPQGMTLLGVNTPAEQNLFLPTDNLEFNLALPNQGLPQNLDWGRMRFRYEVYDIERLLLQRGELPVTTTPQRYDENLQLGQGDSGYWLRVFLHEDLKRFQGQWLAVRFTLTDGTSAYAQGDTAFSIMQPRIPPVDQIEQQRLMRGMGAGRYRHLDPPDYYFGTPRTPPFGDEDRPSWREIVGFGGLVPLGAIGGDTWAKTQPTPDSPIDFSAFPPGDPADGFSSQVIPFEERVPSYKYFVHLQVPAAFPDWMIPRDEAGKPITVRSSGSLMTIYPDLDVTAFARWALEAVKHSAATYYTITSMEGPGYPEYPELIRETARMIKAWEPRLKLGVCGPGGVEGARQLKELDLLENLDFLCNDIYSTVVEDREFVTEVRKSKPSFEYILTEYADITGKGHFGLARNTLQFITSALGSGISKITWMAGPIRKNDYQAGRYTWGPDLWSPYESKGDIELTTAARTTGEG
ncbi:MAG: hypothetical protein GX100_06890, partial [candidate division WS1 bacterium]|nr:hypothetical protein [candidate division WS1 bacterium]